MNYGPTNNFTPSQRSLSATISKGHSKRLYFSTATSSAHVGRVAKAEDCAKSTKFRHVGVVDVSDNLLPRTTNQIAHNEKPNAQYKLNCEAAETSTGRPPASKHTPFHAQNTSTYADFLDKSSKQHASRVPPCPPPEVSIAGCFAGPRATGSTHSQDKFRKPGDQPEPQTWNAMHNLFIREKPTDFWQTRYQREHCQSPPKVDPRRRPHEQSASRFQRSTSAPASALGSPVAPPRPAASQLRPDPSKAWCTSSSQHAFKHPEAAYAMDQKKGSAAINALRAHLASTA